MDSPALPWIVTTCISWVAFALIFFLQSRAHRLVVSSLQGQLTGILKHFGQLVNKACAKDIGAYMALQQTETPQQPPPITDAQMAHLMRMQADITEPYAPDGSSTLMPGAQL